MNCRRSIMLLENDVVQVSNGLVGRQWITRNVLKLQEGRYEPQRVQLWLSQP